MRPEQPWRPSRDEVTAAEGATVPDVVAYGLRVLFCGINPGLYSAAVGHHFARPGNRFWRALHGAGFTDRVLSPFEDGELVTVGLGITNLVERATAGAADLGAGELRKGARVLRGKVERYQPVVLAFVGMQAYRTAFTRPYAAMGQQPDRMGDTCLWLLPNPSGAQARYQLDDLVEAFRGLREYAR